MRNYIFLAIFSMLFLFACQSTPAFVGSWELVSLKLEDESITAKDLGNPTYSFHKDQTYTIEVTGLSQSGTWDLKEDKLVLKDNENPDAENVLTIIQTEDNMFHYTAGSDETKTDVILKRVD